MLKTDFDPQSRKCLICGSDKLLRFKANASDSESLSHVNIVECKNCVFSWQYPISRTKDQSISYFESAYAGNGLPKSRYFDENQKRKIAKFELNFVESLPVTKKRMMDIGAGAGIFAELAAQKGWSVTAVDPAIEPGRLKKNSRIKVIKGTISQIPKGERFDIITLWDVIEHVTNPKKLICEAGLFLRKGGWLVLETGNYKSGDRVKAGINHWIYQLDHRWYFSPESLEQLLTETGFSDFKFSDKVFRPGWKGSVTFSGQSKVHLLKSILKDPFKFPRYISKYLALNKAKKWKMSGIGIFVIAAGKSKN